MLHEKTNTENLRLGERTSAGPAFMFCLGDKNDFAVLALKKVQKIFLFAKW